MIILGLNNRINAATLTSTGTFVATLPLDNLKTNILAEVARTTTDAALTITVDLTGEPARSIGALAIAGHNLSRTATVQYQTYQGETEVNDSGVLSPWPYLHPDDPHWSAHTYTAAIIDTDRIAEAQPISLYFLPTNTAANKVIISITDTSNPDNYIEIGRLFVGEQFEPDMGEEYEKTGTGLFDYSEIITTQRHLLYENPYIPLRTAQIPYGHLTTAEAIGAIRTAQKRARMTGEWLIAPYRPIYETISGVQAPESFWFEMAFMARQTSIDFLIDPYQGAKATTLNLEEIAP